jgi:hypothetical protein
MLSYDGFVPFSTHCLIFWMLRSLCCAFAKLVGRKHSNADGMSRVPCKQCQHCGASEDTDSKHTIHTAVSQKSDITHSGDTTQVARWSDIMTVT